MLSILYLWYGEKEFLQQAVASWIWRNCKINLHVKVRNFAELASNIGFSEFDFYDLYRSTFEKSELGRMKELLPLHAMAETFGLISTRVVWPEASQGPDEADGNPVDLRRPPHGKRGAAGRQDRAESTTGGLLKRKHAQWKVLSHGNYASVMENWQKIRPKRPEWDIKTEIWWPESRNGWVQTAASVKNIKRQSLYTIVR